MSIKPAIVFLLIISIGPTANAQAPWLQRPDSLKKVLETTTDDDARLKLLSTLFVRYIWSSPDSALPYAQQYMLLAQKKKSNNLLVNAYTNQSILAQLSGNFPQALQYGFKALAIAEETKNFLVICGSRNTISDIYLAQGDVERSILYARKGLDILKANYSLPSEQPTYDTDTLSQYASSTYTLCKAYIENGQPDSVLKYIKLVEWIWGHQWTKPKKRWPTIPLTYGKVNYQLGNYSIANSYYHEGIADAEYWHLSQDLMDNLNSLAQSHQKMNQLDSAIHYAKKVLKVSETAQNPIVKMEALSLLANVFKIKNKIDSSAKYFELTLATKDSLFNQSKIVEMQNSTFNEQLRQQEVEEAENQRINRYRTYAFVGGLGALVIIAVVLYRNVRVKQKANEKIEKAYSELKAAQSQLIHAEKMASLGELTAGIAHEIQNPLNFVNNFSELNTELINELEEEASKGNIDGLKGLAKDIKDNEEKILHHGKRADSIVKGMLQHSRSSSGVKELTDINVLADEYLRLAYHGHRAKDKSFNVKMDTSFDGTIGSIKIIPQDIGRVILNLINNALYAVTEKKKMSDDKYEPTITVTTKKENASPDDPIGRETITIAIKDNGNGIRRETLDKIFQPFFTTKPTGQGTGLGLSLSYDIVKAHGGELKVATKDGHGAEFIIQIPGKE